MKFYNNDSCEESAFSASLRKLVKVMRILEENKYMEPKFSQFLLPLNDFILSKLLQGVEKFSVKYKLYYFFIFFPLIFLYNKLNRQRCVSIYYVEEK